MSMLGGEEMELGKQIKKHRQEVQLSQEELAERLNVKIKGEQHNALNDAVLLYGVCRELNIQMSI